MLRIVGYIEKLLAQYDCVMIPSIGAIMKETLSPVFSVNEKIVYPACEVFHFNPDLRDRDNLLDTLYSRNYGVSLRRAKLMVDKDVSLLRTTLISNREVSIGKIGRFQMQEGGLILFLPAKTKDFLGSSDFYGLLPCRLPIASRETVYNSQANAAILSDSRQDKAYWYFRIHKRIGSVAAMLVLTFLVFMPSSINTVRDRYSAGFSSTKITTTSSSENIVLPDLEDIFPLNKLSLIPLSNDVYYSSDDDSLENDKISLDAHEYFAVIGVFSSEHKVKNYMEKFRDFPFLDSMGYVKDGNRYLIYAYSSSSRESVDKFILSLRSEYNDYRDIWVFHRNK